MMRDRKRLEALIADDEQLVRRTGDIDAYFELAREGEDVLEDLDREIKSLASFAEELEARTMLSGETDPLNAIVTYIPAPAEPRARTGPRCCCACICAGRSSRASRRLDELPERRNYVTQQEDSTAKLLENGLFVDGTRLEGSGSIQRRSGNDAVESDSDFVHILPGSR